MNIVISTHFDLARPVMFIKMDAEKLSGLVDNLAGVFASYQAARKTGTPIYFTNYEELYMDGAEDVAKNLDKENTIVIVVDTSRASECPDGKHVAIYNFYNLDENILKSKLQDQASFRDGFFEPDLDETKIYGKKFGFRTFYFGVPFEQEDHHATNNSALLGRIDKASEILVEVINILKNQK